MKIALIQNQSAESADKLVFTIETLFSAQVDLYSDFPSEAPKDALDLLIIDWLKPKSAKIEKTLTHFANIPVILIADSTSEQPVIETLAPKVSATIERGLLFDQISSVVEGLIQSGVIKNIKGKSGFVRIRTKLLLDVNPLDAEVFIKLNDMKYIKLMNAGDRFTQDDLDKYTKKKGVEYLYLNAASAEIFTGRYIEELEKIIKRPQAKPDMEQAGVQHEAVFEAVQSMMSEFGFKPQVQQLAKTQIAATMKAIGSAPKLSDVVAQLKKIQGKYGASHSFACAYLACAIASGVKWASETTFHKLNLAAFFHDAPLTNDELAEIQSFEELEEKKDKFDEREIQLFKTHTARAAELVRQFKEIPPDVDKIIMEHHERPDGNGFPRKIKANQIAPLSCVFIIAHDLALEMRRKGDDFNLDQFMADQDEYYNHGQFKVVKIGLTVLKS
ncbi:MAG: HD domain-containing protein [Xanthomonadaceae bacterium]|nr:HD domain-containing protein [Xanthomonadaceae bacterium]